MKSIVVDLITAKIKALMKRTLLLLSSLLTIAANAQNVGINATGAAPAASAMLDISSTNSGLLIPRMTTAQRTAIAAPATGLLVYDTNLSSFYYYDGTQWVWMLSNTTGWTLSGNTIAAANLIGTTNAQPFRVFCNNV